MKDIALNYMSIFPESIKNVSIKKTVVIILFLSLLSACTGSNPYNGNPDAIKDGAILYKDNCERCHGPEGRGGVCPNLIDRKWIYGGTDRELFKSIYSGRPGGMPAWKGIVDKEGIWKIIAYIRTLER